MTSWLPFNQTTEDRLRLIHVRLLDHVNVYKLDADNKEFTLYCDPLYRENNEEIGRFSTIQYKIDDAGEDFYGKILCLLFYGVVKDDLTEEFFLTAVVAKLIISIDDKGTFPMPKYSFEKLRDHRYQLHQIELKNIIGPVFGISHGVEAFSVSNNKVNNKNTLLLFTPELIHCTPRLDYDNYIMNNRIMKSSKNRKSVLDLHMFMSIQEIIDLKISLFVDEKCMKKGNVDEPLVSVIEPDQEIHLSDLDVSDDSEDSVDDDSELE